MEEKELIKYLHAIQQVEMNSIPPNKQLEKQIVFSDSFTKRMDRLIRKNRNKAKNHKIIQYAVTIAAVVLLMISFLFPQYAARAGDVFMEWFRDHISIQFKEEPVETHTKEKYKLDYIPDGFQLKYENYDETGGKVVYYNTMQSEEYLSLQYTYSESSVGYHIDNENTDMEETFDDDGNEVFLFRYKDGSNCLLWKDKKTGSTYLLDGYIDEDEIWKVKDNIINIE